MLHIVEYNVYLRTKIPTLHTLWTLGLLKAQEKERQTRHTFLLLQIILVEYMLTHANSVDASDSQPKINSLERS